MGSKLSMGADGTTADDEKNLSVIKGNNLSETIVLDSSQDESNTKATEHNEMDEIEAMNAQIISDRAQTEKEPELLTKNKKKVEFSSINGNGEKCVENTNSSNSKIEKSPIKKYNLRIVPLERLLENPRKITKDTCALGSLSPPILCLDSDSENETIVNTVPATKVNLSGKNLKESTSKKICNITTKNVDTIANTTDTAVKHQKSASKVKKNSNNTLNKDLLKKCRKFKIRIKRCKQEELVRSRKVDSASTIQKNTKAKKNSNMADTEKPTTSARAKKRQFKNLSDESDFEDSIKQISDDEEKSAASDVESLVKTSEDEAHSDGTKSSDSEIMPTRKKRVFSKRKKSSSDDSDFEPSKKKKQAANVMESKNGKNRRRIKNNDTSEDDEDGDSDEDGENNKKKRKHIRKIIKTSDLDISTKNAAKEEETRRKRIEERQKLYNQIYEKPESTEVSELILDFDEETKKPLLEVDKGLLKKLKPHQVTGVKFMWDACFETVKDIQNKPGSGCILAHCMGLGKTLQVVTLSHTLISNSRRTGVERVLIISPLSTLNNWAREFIQWMNFARKKNIEIYDMSKFRDKNTRIFKLNEWFTEGGVCILGYDMYRILANEKAKGLRKKQRETLQEALVDPGPDLVVCDEGHLLKNEKTSISKAVTKMRTQRRIVLTGTPLQNNLKEYYCMIQFIKPNLLGTYKEYMNRFVNPINNGQYTDSTERDIRLMKHRSHILHKMLEGCIQRRDYSVLAPYLPPKHEYVVYTTLSPLQQKLYEYYMTTQRDLISSDLSGKGARLFQDFQDLRRIWTHPMCLRVNSDHVIRKRVLANEEDSMDEFICDDEDENETSASSSDDDSADSNKSFASGNDGSSKTTRKQRKTRNNKNSENSDGSDCVVSSLNTTQCVQQDDPSEWWKKFVDDKELNCVKHSAKMMILMRLLEQCEAIGDKLLVFSQSLQSLDVIEHFLGLVDKSTKGTLNEDADVGDFKGMWQLGRDYFRLDGTSSVEQRESMCKQFNNETNLRARLFLISTRAGGLGINLVAANRVVIFDVSWNPSHDTQSIFRVYRFGQDKPCYIYRLIAMGTMEQKVYERQVAKQATAKRVIDEQQISRHYNQSDLLELYTYELQADMEKREVPILPKDRLFAELLSEHPTLLYKYHEHDSLLENEESENLSEAERTAAWSEYEAEKTRSVQTTQYISYDRGAYGGTFGNASSSVTCNKIFGFRTDVLLQLLNLKIAKDHPEYTQNQVICEVPNYLNALYEEMNHGDPTMYKELLALHTTLEHPSGMYMNPLLYANQNPGAAGYFQAPTAGQPPAAPPGFDPNQVIELD